MESLQKQLKKRFEVALSHIVPESVGVVDPLLKETNDKKFGDYQCNIAMGLAKQMKRPPREIAEQIVKTVDLKPFCSKVEIAGPGFINIHLDQNYLSKTLKTLLQDDRLGIEPVSNPIHHVIDFSSPNLAKEMHIGHLRTTITGEVIARIIEFQGHTIERVNHVGDWGTQFGMLLQHIYEKYPTVLSHPEEFEIKDLEVFYKEAKKQFDDDEKFRKEARQKVVLLQSGDETARKLWKIFLQESLRHCHELYQILDVHLEDKGESFYNEMLPQVVEELRAKGIALEDQGAVCVFLEGFQNREGEPLPFIIQKSDGGYNYATTDLAALKYRIQECQAKRIIIVTDIRQAQHFKMLFATGRKAGWVTADIELDHIGYGMILGPDKKPFKTREGGTVQLKAVIEESIGRARQIVGQSQNENLQKASEEEKQDVAEAVGLAAIKYYDLSHNLASDYVFGWDRVLSMEGNTGPYMLYAYARIKSIGRKAGVDLDSYDDGEILLEHSSEMDLAKALIRFGDVIEDVSKDLKPNLLTDYLYQLSKTFHAFYDKQRGVRVLDAENEDFKKSRLLLCSLTAKTLKLGLNLLSIRTIEAM